MPALQRTMNVHACKIVDFISRRAWLKDIVLKLEILVVANTLLYSSFILICRKTYGGPQFYKIVKHEQQSLLTFWQQAFVGKIQFGLT